MPAWNNPGEFEFIEAKEHINVKMNARFMVNKGSTNGTLFTYKADGKKVKQNIETQLQKHPCTVL